MTEGPESLATRLERARDRAFVGRATEVELFVQALESVEPAFGVLFVHGPGGIGKSTLLDRLAREASVRHVACHRVERRSAGASPAAFLHAIGAETLDELRNRPRSTLFIDGYEELEPLDPWIREELLPSLPGSSVVVIASRERPSPEWRSDPGIASLLRVRALENLAPDESAALLAARGVDAGRCGTAVHALTHGHPLALALAAELMRESGAVGLPALTPDIVRVLLERIVRALPSDDHRAALEVTALARVVTENLLRDLGVPSPRSLYEFLRRLSYTRETDEGVVIHDLVRDAIVAELGSRDPARLTSLRESIADRAAAAVRDTTGRAREHAFFDLLFGMRTDPVTRTYYDWERGHGTTRPLRRAELAAALEDVRRYEGEASSEIAEHWWSRQESAFVALENDGRYLGFLTYLRLREIDERDRVDPAIASIEASLRAAPLRDGEHFTILRFWVWREGYQELGNAAHHPHSMFVALDWMSSPMLARSFCAVQRAERWRSFLPQIGFLEDSCFTTGERAFYLFSRDFRLVPWGASVGPNARLVMTRDEFGAALRSALKSLAKPAELADSPLLRTRLLADWADGETPAPAMIGELVEVALSSASTDDRPRRCVELTFVRGAPTQEAAAERLGLSFSTYRRQLERGVEAVIDYLWNRELRRP